jgi:hypothetical protein
MRLKPREYRRCITLKQPKCFLVGTDLAMVVATMETIMEMPCSTLQTTEKRRATRQKAFVAAHLQFNKGNSTYEALVKNLSTTGVKLRFGELIDLPPEFAIKVGAENTYHKAHVAWRQGFEIGVAFAA